MHVLIHSASAHQTIEEVTVRRGGLHNEHAIKAY